MPVGTTGESPTLTHEEHKRSSNGASTQAKGRVPVDRRRRLEQSTTEAIELAHHAEKAGADAVLVVTPYYNKPTQEGLYQHFKAINDAIGIPIIIYNIPPRSVIDMSVDTMARLLRAEEHRRREGRDRQYGARQRSSAPRMGPDFNQLSGEDIDGARLHGAWRPRLHLGDVQRRAAAVRRVPGGLPARRLRRRAARCRTGSMPLHTHLFVETSPAPTKYALSLLGKCATTVRLPMVHGRPRRREAAVRDGHGPCRPDQR